MNKRQLFLILFLLVINKSWAQQAYPVTDTQPLQMNGLEIGYIIKSQEVKTVGDKGDFSRYAVKFYVTNTTNWAKIIFYRDGPDILGNVSAQLVRFNCLNATGARFTSNTAILNAEPCKVLALVDDRDGNANKIVQNKRWVQIGYWIKPGQTISADEIVIVPLNDRPHVEVLYFADQSQPAVPVPYTGTGAGYIPQNDPQPTLITSQEFLKIRNTANNTYINNQTGPPNSTTIDNGWWSAQWKFIPVNGTSYFSIKNRWKLNFIDIDRGYVVLSETYQPQNCMWSMEPTRDPAIFRIRNAQTGGYLCIASSGKLILSANAVNDPSSAWQLEQP